MAASRLLNPAPSCATALQAAFADFSASTAQLAAQDEDLRGSVELLRRDVALTHSRLHEEMRRRVRSEAQMGSMFGSVPFGLVAIDAGRVTGFNPAAAKLLPDLVLQGVWALPAQWMRRGTTDEYLTDRGSEARIISVCALTDTASGTRLLHIDDITEAHRERERAERQERLASMGRMSAELAHQLRTPLCTATLYASQLREPDIDADERSAMAGRLVGQLGQIDALITRMLSFVKTRARAQEIGPIEALVRSQLEVIAPLLAQRGVRLALALHAPDCVIAVDRLQIGSAVLALLENALQHAPPGSTVSVACRSEGHRVEICVTDEGPGIDPAIAARLFEPFATGRPTGTGLGLAMARAAAQAHRGELSFAACEPHGVRFTLALPALPQV